MKSNSMSPIQSIVIKLITAGHVLQVEKTKWAKDGGCQWVTVGPYKAATNERKYAVFIGAERHEFMFAYDAAKFFIQWVGRSLAQSCARQFIVNNRLNPLAYGVNGKYNFQTGRVEW